MSTKPQQLPHYRSVPPLLRKLRESRGLTQRQLGVLLKRRQSWVFNCETFNRRVDVAEFVSWARACGADPVETFRTVADKVK